MLYNQVKADMIEDEKRSSFDKGANHAYANKATKQAVSSTGGSSSASQLGKLTRKMIRDWSIDEYKMRLSEVNEALKNGTIE